MKHQKEFSFGVATGFFYGMFLVTGQNIDPESLGLLIGDTFNNATKTGQTPTMWDQLRPWLLLLSVIATIATIFYVVSRGLIAIIVALFGFIGALFLVLCAKNTDFIWISLPCLIIGGILSNMDT
jgi:hypothetical protein